jgi:nucleotide-binding universal stress UspA family protein
LTFANHILVATDLSPASHAALQEAAALVRALGCPVTLLHVLELPPWLEANEPGRSESMRRRIAEEAAGAAQSVLFDLRDKFFPGIAGVTTRMLEHASAAQAICAVASDIPADLLVVSSRGRTGASGVTEKIVRSAPCRVLVVPVEDALVFAH